MPGSALTEGQENDMAAGRLWVIATPIGNLDDLSPRAAELLRTADLVAAEDTRHSAPLLARVGSAARMIALHEHRSEPLSVLEAALAPAVHLQFQVWIGNEFLRQRHLTPGIVEVRAIPRRTLPRPVFPEEQRRHRRRSPNCRLRRRSCRPLRKGC